MLTFTCRHLAVSSLLRRVQYFSKGKQLKIPLKDGPSLQHFIAMSSTNQNFTPSYSQSDSGRRVYIETYGCQMNVNDTDIARSILHEAGFVLSNDTKDADAVLLMTCAIREGAESKIWRRLADLKKRRHRKAKPFVIGVLGCMAERLKTKLIEKEQSVDIVCGPDAYRDLPRLLGAAEAGHKGINVQLSLEETYADIIPVRRCADAPSAYVSIMRGCDNMCTYCIVPFTRGRERSRPLASIVEEVSHLVDSGVREVVLLGQNVNSYRDLSDGADRSTVTAMADGFSTVYRKKSGGRRFTELLDAVSSVHGELRVRFTSPHPKDFPDDVLSLIADRPNICSALHLPAQSGSSSVLSAMGRGYTREAYLALVSRARSLIPRVTLSGDFIAGFCGETEEDHLETLSLMDEVKYNYIFCFPYSQREKTRAHRRLVDDVPEDVKKRRHIELYDRFREHAEMRNKAEIGGRHLVLVEGKSRRSDVALTGRNDGNTRVVFPLKDLQDAAGSSQRQPKPGDYVEVEVTSVTSQTLLGEPVAISSIADFYRKGN